MGTATLAQARSAAGVLPRTKPLRMLGRAQVVTTCSAETRNINVGEGQLGRGGYEIVS